MVRLAVAIVFLCTLATPDAIAAASSPVRIPDSRYIKAGAITVVHAALMIADVVNDIAVAIRQPRALTTC